MVVSATPLRPVVHRRSPTATIRGGQLGSARNAVLGARPRFGVFLTQERKLSRKSCAVRAFKSGGSTTAAPPRTSISEEKQILTLYDLLGISGEVGIREIKTAYREKARQFHPDANPPAMKDECTKMFLQVQEAYEVLMDPGTRANYDYSLLNPLSTQALKSGMPFRRPRNKGRGSASESADVDKQAWKSQWRSQLDGLKRDYCRTNPSPWATAMNERRRTAAAARQGASVV